MIILSLLLEKDSYGYEISKEIEARTDKIYCIKETTLYSAFNRLEANGHVASYFGDETFGKRRTYYRITNLGRSYYLEKCEEWKIAVKVIDLFVMKEGH